MRGIDDLSQLERDILVWLLVDGASAPKPIGEEVDAHRNSVSRSLSSLRDDRLVVDKGSGVWTLTCEGFSAARLIYRERRD